MKDTKALRPGSFSFSDFIQEDTQTGLDITEGELLFSKGRQTAFWKELKKHFDNEIRQLDDIQDNAIATGASRDQIGENAVVISLTRGVLKRIVNRIEDAREADEK